MAQQRLLRLTRHEASEAQVTEARCIFGADLEIVTISETVPDAARVRQLVEANAATVLEAVLPPDFTACPSFKLKVTTLPATSDFKSI